MINEYIQCDRCHSFTLLSDQTAEIDNQIYFDNFFKEVHEFSESLFKKEIFRRYQMLDQQKRMAEYNVFQNFQQSLKSVFTCDKKVLEVGFGTGENLVNLLQSGIDAYGIDLSAAAVSEFKTKYPQFQERVFYGTRYDGKIGTVYSCALFEHLDQPRQFLSDIYENLDKNGLLILDGVPLLNKKKSELTPDNDINFWKPCHRVIYSYEGLKNITTVAGFDLISLKEIDSYTYRVLSMILKNGYNKIVDLRNPFFNVEGLPEEDEFLLMCEEALTINSLALYSTSIFRKV